LTVSVIGVRSDSGTVRGGLYSSPAGFREPGHELRGAVAQIFTPSTTRRRWNRPVRQAEQGYGFSNNPASTFGPPSFSSAAVRVPGRRPESAGAAELLAPSPFGRLKIVAA
jgi:uncharacterized protein (DUF2141 family)